MNRINLPVHSSRTAPRIDFGLVAWLEETRIRLPLQGVECRFDVSGDIATVELEQIFYQTNTVPLNCTYTFPLPGNAAVYRCEIQIGSRIIRARVEEEEKARKLFREKVAEGHRAGLVETERENLFTLSLGNIQPHDNIVVKLAYFQTVERCGPEVSLLIPFCPGVRYIPGLPLWRESQGSGVVPDTDQVPDASRISPPRIGANHEDAAYVSVTGRLDNAAIDPEKISSPLHKIAVTKDENKIVVQLHLGADIPDRDFVLRWQEAAAAATLAHGWACEDSSHTYALVQLKAPVHSPVAENYAQDHYFLIDRSGSMAGEKWLKTADALKQFVRALGANDRVWLTFFETNFSDFAERLLSPRELLEDKNFSKIEERGAHGGTEMLPALQHVTGKITKFSSNQTRPANLIIITDGQVGNEDAILEALRAYPKLRVFTFGIDVAVNDAFLRNLARRHHGFATFRTPDEDISSAVAALAAKLRQPVIISLQVNGQCEPAQSTLPDLFAGDLLLVPVRLGTGASRVTFSGRLPNGDSHTLSIDLTQSTNPAIKLLWARERIEELLDQGRQPEAIELAIANNIICKGASFIAWDEDEKVVVAQKELYQPNVEIHEVSASMDMDRMAGGHSDSQYIRRASLGLADHVSQLAFKVHPLDHSSVHGGPIVIISLFGTAAIPFAEALERWAGADSAETNRRRAALRKLTTELTRHAHDRPKCKELCLQFVRYQVIEPTLGLLLRELISHLKRDGANPLACRQGCAEFLRQLDQSESEKLLELCQAL